MYNIHTYISFGTDIMLKKSFPRNVSKNKKIFIYTRFLAVCCAGSCRPTEYYFVRMRNSQSVNLSIFSQEAFYTAASFSLGLCLA